MFDAEADAHRLRLGFFVVALVALAVLLAAGVVSTRTQWGRHQERFIATGLGDERPGIIEVHTCAGDVDRCMTCHVGIDRRDVVRRDLEPPLAPHPVSLEAHPPHVVGCTACHGGTGRALRAGTAHAMPGTTGIDPLHARPYIEASCARCHVPGGVPGTDRLARGADLYLRLGCAMCHSLSPGGRGGWDYGPDLRGLGRQSITYLRASLIEPTANFAGSTMPPYRASFTDHPESLDDLLIFVQALALEPLQSCAPGAGALVRDRCSSCHAGVDRRAVGHMEHRCIYIEARAAELTCRGCHAGEADGTGSGDGYCPLVRAHRSACDACHSGGSPW